MSTDIPVNVEDQFELITGRTPTVDDYAVFDHVFGVERARSNGPSSATTPLEIGEYELDSFNKALLLNRDDDDADLYMIMNVPGLYRMLLYYHLMPLNDSLVKGGWIQSINPVYSADRMSVEADVPTIDRFNYIHYINDTNQEYETILYERSNKGGYGMYFILSMIYSSVISSELTMRPFSRDVHTTIRSLIDDSALRYYQLPDDRGAVTDPAEWIKTWRENDTQFYSDIEHVPETELFLTVDKLVSAGAYGTTFLGRFAGDIPVFMKHSLYLYDPIHEYRIGMELNKYYSECPFIMYTYGVTKLNMNNHTLNNYQAILDNRSEYNIEGDQDMPVLITQWLPNARSFAELLFDDNMYVTRYDEQGRIVEVDVEYAIQHILMAILCTLKFLWEKTGFVHGDLHLENIQIVQFNTPQVLPLPGYPGRVFNLSAVPILIDYGLSSVLRLPSHMVSSNILPISSESVWNSVDINLASDQVYVGDVVKLLVHTFSAVSTYSPKLGNLLASTYYHIFTGNRPESEFVQKTIYDELKSKIGFGMSGSTPLMNRLPPAGITTYDPDAAITEFVHITYDEPELTSNIYTPYLLDSHIHNMVRKDGLMISSYVGAVIYKLYGDRIRYEATYTDDVIKSWIDLQQNLDSNYTKSLEELDESTAEYSTLKDSIEIQYVYRKQINELIKKTIPQ